MRQVDGISVFRGPVSVGCGIVRHSDGGLTWVPIHGCGELGFRAS